MKTLFKRVLCLLLVLVLTGSMLPTVFATGSGEEPTILTDEDYASADAVFAQIDDMADSPAKKNASQSQLTDAAMALVMASDSYVEGSLERNGNCFTWWTTDGIHCVYNPRMQNIQKNMVAPENPLADGIYNEPVATKGGWPNSRDVYLIGPYYGSDSEFTDQYKNEAAAIASAIGDTDGYTLYSGTACTVDNVAEAVSNGAVIIFDSHGSTDYENGYDYVTGATSSYLCLQSRTGMTTEDQQDGALYGNGYAYINGATIANHMTKNSPSGIVWMAICLGMATDTLCNPLRDMGVEVVYGYSQSVTFAGDYLFEETFWDNMIAGNDVATSIAAMKNRWGTWDWSTAIASYYGYSDGYTTISAARSDYAAFPIVVSDEDTHPGQRNGTSFYGADSLQTVKSTYTLFAQYEISAQSNNSTYGTVSVNGRTITATPADGYFAESATVLSGSATYTQNGNIFTVDAQSDCTIQINFAPKTPVTVSFSGATVASQSGYSGDEMTLPTAQASDGYTFLGWMSAPLSENTTEKPSYYTTSFTPTGNTTLYALYSYVDENTSTGTGDYVKVTETPDDWSGEYLVVYEDDNLIFDGSLDTLDAKNNVQSVTITNNTISADAADAYKFTIEKTDGGYAIKSVCGQYIGGSSTSNTIVTSDSPINNSISLDTSNNATIQNGGYLRYNASDNRFRYYKPSSYSSQKAIALYVKDGAKGTTYYTGSAVKCEHTSTTNVAAVPATCTTSGYTAGVQCNDCQSFISGHTVIDALGHSWSEWTQTQAPTCTEAGKETRTCSVCGEVEIQSDSATGHNYESVVTPPTASEQGYTTYTCTICGDSYVNDYVEALGQTYTVSFNVPSGVTPIKDMLCGKNGITLPQADVPSGDYAYTFEGWVVQQVDTTETAPQIYPAGALITTEGNITLYALYSYVVGGTGTSEYVLTDISKIGANDVFVITMQYQDGTIYALDNAAVAKAPAAPIVTATDGKLTTTPDSNLLWNLGGSNNAWIFYPNGTTSRWLASTDTNNGMSVGTNTGNTYKISGNYLQNISTNRYVGIFRTNPDWRCYTGTSGTNIADQTFGLYVKTESGTTYYTTEFGTVAAAVYGGDQQVAIYETVEEAYEACENGYYVKLLADSQVDLTLTKDFVLDLNGFTLTGSLNPGSYSIYGMDTRTDDYDNADQGLLACTGITDQIVVHLQMGTKRYMAIQEENGWSFHRYYLGITHINLSTTTTGIGYKAVFHGDNAVMAQLNSDRAFGYTLSLNGGKEVSRYMSADKIVSGKAVTLRVNNFDAAKFGEKPLNAYVSVVLGKYIIKSAVQQVTLRQVVESINENYTNFKQAQLDAVKAMIEKNPAMLNWQVDNIMKEEVITVPTVKDPVPGTAYKFGMIQEKVSTTDIYYLAGTMDGYYMATTTDPAAAIDVYIEETTGGYYLYTIINGSKFYINMVVSDTHVNGAYEATASTVYSYDTTAQTVIANINGTDYHFGTRNDRTYTTIGPCATSYNGFYAMFYLVPEN